MTSNEPSRPEQPLPPVEGPPPRPIGQPVVPVDWFRHMPNGGATVYLRPAEIAQND